MRKKYLSALLFGALLVTSTGTFTSCKDYDDDINNLQEQITANADAIKKLQEMIGDGKFVTGVTAENNGLKITWNDGQSTVIENVINGEAQQGDVVTINAETGEIVINGEGTGFFATKGEGEIKLPYVNDEGVLVLVDAEGKEVVTGIRVAPVTAVVNEDGSAVLTIIAADGTKQEILIPSVSSLLSEIELVGYQKDGTNDANGFKPVEDGTVQAVVYKITAANATNMAKNWKGNKAILKENEVTVAYDTKGLVTRIAPTQVDGKSLDFTLINTKGEEAPVSVTLSDFTGKLTRAASTNSMYNVEMECVIGKADATTSALVWANNYYMSNGKAVLFALKEKGGLVSKFDIAFNATDVNPYTIDEVYISNPNDWNDGKDGLIVEANHTSATTPYEISAGNKYFMSLDDEPYVYDSYLEFEEDQALYWQVEYDKSNDPMAFTVKRMPDSQTPAPLRITVHYVTMDGVIGKKVVYVVPRTNLSSIVLCDPIKHAITAYNANDKSKNAITVSLDKVFSTLGNDGTITWKADVDLASTIASGISILNTTNYDPIADSYDVEFLDKDNKVTNKASEAVKVRFTFKNNAAIDLSKDYIATINFMSNKTDKYFGGVVNTATFSANFSIPAFTDLLQKDMNVFDAEGKVASAYMLDAYAYETPGGVATSTYKFQSAFTNLGANVEKGFTFDLELDDDNNNIIVDNLTSAGVANLAFNNYAGTGSRTLSVTSKDIANGAAVTLDNAKAYGKELIVKLTTAKYVGVYSYDDISFKIKLLSPIKEGKFEAKGGAVEVAATDVTTVTAEQVWGLTAKSIKYDLFKTAVKQSDGTFKGNDWARQDVASVTFSTDGTKVTIQEPAGATTKGEPTDAIVDSKTGSITTPSSIALRASGNVGDRDKLTIKVKDIWGYELTNQVDVVVK